MPCTALQSEQRNQKHRVGVSLRDWVVALQPGPESLCFSFHESRQATDLPLTGVS